MNTQWRISTLAVVAICALDVLPAQAQAKPPRDLLMGHDVRLELVGGASTTGELLGVTADSLSVLVKAQGTQVLGFDRIIEMEIARHSFGWNKVWTWTAVGALVTGAGMTAACSSVEGAECGSVFVGTVLSWGLFGGIFGAVINAKRWQWVAPSPEAARPFSRYPQGVPETRPRR